MANEMGCRLGAGLADGNWQYAAFSLARDCAGTVKSRGVAWKRKLSGGMLAVVGFMLSPLSWWNDLFVNVPLALAFAWVVSLFYRPAFSVCLVIGYWLTNVLGFVLMHKGGQKMLFKEEQKYSKRALLRDVGISFLYTALILLLLKIGVLKPIRNYFR